MNLTRAVEHVDCDGLSVDTPFHGLLQPGHLLLSHKAVSVIGHTDDTNIEISIETNEIDSNTPNPSTARGHWTPVNTTLKPQHKYQYRFDRVILFLQ